MGANALPGGLHDAEGRLMANDDLLAYDNTVEQAMIQALQAEVSRLAAALQEAQGKAALADRYRRIRSLFDTAEIDDDYDALTSEEGAGR